MEEAKVAHTTGTAELEVSYDISNLLALDGAREVLVHGYKLVFNKSAIDEYLNGNEASMDDLVLFVESKISKEDAESIAKKQMKSRITGTTFSIDTLGQLSSDVEQHLEIIVPKIKLDVEVVKSSIDAIQNDDLTKYTTYLPPLAGDENQSKVKCITGNAMRSFFNSMQKDDSGLDMNTQIKIYATMLTSMPDADPTKMYGLTQLRALMQYGDIVSNRNLRLALTQLLEED